MSTAGAQGAITAIDTALDTVNGIRSDYSAVQNRLDSALANTSTYLESITSTAGNIRDADFSADTPEMTKQQIMQQGPRTCLSQWSLCAHDSLNQPSA